MPSRFENVPPAFRSFSGKKKTKKTKKLPTYCVFCKVATEYELDMYQTLTDYLFTLADTSDTCHNTSVNKIIFHAKLNPNNFQNNNEPESIYTSHVLKDPDNKVVCPALYVYVCPICNNTGHQVRYKGSGILPQLK